MTMKNSSLSKKIALIGYEGSYFKSFANALEETGFEVYWVCANRSEAVYLKNKMLIPEQRVLDVSIGIKKRNSNKRTSEESHLILSELETLDGPRIYDIILMDRILRNIKTSKALMYLAHLKKELTVFFEKNNISIVTSGRDTALQLMSMLICKKYEIKWVVPTRLRIPLNVYGFCTGHDTDSFIRFQNTTDKDHIWAETVLKNFNNAYYRPALKRATRNFRDVIFMLPVHFKTILKLLKFSLWDRGNNFQRNSISKTILMYIRRRYNMFGYKLFPPYSPIGSQPYCIYALHTQPESSIDVAGSFFSDQIALITIIARSLPVTHELYVKVHPTDVDGKPLSFYKKINQIPGVRLINYDISSRDLVQKASIIFTLTGTMGYEAGLMGKHVITFAKNFYNELPTVNYCDVPPKLPALINSLLNIKPSVDSREKIINFLEDYRSRIFDGEVNRCYGENPTSLSSQDLITLQKAYNNIFEIVLSKNLSNEFKRF